MIPALKKLIRGPWQVAQRDRNLFALCLMAACAYWAVVALQQTSQTEVNLQINLGTNNSIHQKSAHIQTIVEGSVFRLALIEISGRINPSIIELVSPWNQKTPLTQQTELQNWAKKHRVAIRATVPERLTPEFRIAEKRIPVQIQANISYAVGWGPLSGGTSAQFDSVTVVGPAVIIDTLTSITTQKVNLRVDGELKTAPLQAQPLPIGVKCLEPLAKNIIRVRAQRYTEASAKIPVQINQNGRLMLCFPKEVEVRYSIPLSLFGKIKNSEIRVFANTESDLSELPAQVITSNELIINSYAIPNSVRVVVF